MSEGCACIVEVDEHGHAEYDVAKEVHRMNRITDELGGSVVWIRYNPDPIDASETRGSAKKRKAELLDLLERTWLDPGYVPARAADVHFVGYAPLRREALLAAL